MEVDQKRCPKTGPKSVSESKVLSKGTSMLPLQTRTEMDDSDPELRPELEGVRDQNRSSETEPASGEGSG